MMISFWTGFALMVLLGILIMFIGYLITKKISKNGAVGSIFGFFGGVALVFVLLLTAGRLYVVSGDAEFTDYLVYGDQTYTLKDGTQLEVKMNGKQCMVINDWEKPVVVESVIYGGYGFGGDTKWVEPQEAELFEENKIFYFYDDGPPDEIMIKSDDKQVTRLWLRNKRD